jgi:hypothetical protein
MSTAAIVGGSLGAGLIGAIGSNSAADTQAGAANNAAQLQSQAANNALNFQKQVYGNSLQMGAPGLAMGTGAMSKLSYLMGIPGVSGLNQQAIANGFQQPQQQGTQPGSSLLNLLGGGGLGSLGQAGGAGNFGGPQLMSAQSAMVPNSGAPQLMNAQSAMMGNGGSAMVGANATNTGLSSINGGGSMLNRVIGGEAGTPGGPINPGGSFTGGPQASGTPGGVDPSQGGGVIQANGGGSAQVPFDPNAAGGAAGAQGGFGSLLTPYGQTFQAPTSVTEQNDPGYQFRLQQGQDALQNSAAARGGLLSGGTAKALSDYTKTLPQTSMATSTTVHSINSRAITTNTTTTKTLNTTGWQT